MDASPNFRILIAAGIMNTQKKLKLMMSNRASAAKIIPDMPPKSHTNATVRSRVEMDEDELNPLG